MTLREFQVAHRKYCGRQCKKCGHERNLDSRDCMKCVLDFLNAQAALEQYDKKAEVSNKAPQFSTLSDADVRRGMQDLVKQIRLGHGERILPVGARPVISGIVFEVVDHDTVAVSGKEHTMTLRVLARDYPEMPFDAENNSNRWDTSRVRKFLNEELLGKFSEPLREVMVAPVLRTVYDAEDFADTEDLVWIPSSSQLGFTDDEDIIEGDVLDAYDRALTVDSAARRIVAEYHGDDIVPKNYWLRSISTGENKVCVVNHMGKLGEFEPNATTAMIVPYITIA